MSIVAPFKSNSIVEAIIYGIILPFLIATIILLILTKYLYEKREELIKDLNSAEFCCIISINSPSSVSCTSVQISNFGEISIGGKHCKAIVITGVYAP